MFRSVLARLGRLLAAVFDKMGATLRALFGQINWTPPAWANRVAGGTGGRKVAIGVLVFVLAAGVWAEWTPIKARWQALRSHFSTATVTGGGKVTYPNLGVTLIAPTRTDIENNGAPKPVVLEFNGPAAPLGRVGKDALDVSLDPKLEGHWTWTSDTRLEFVPKSDWPVGEAYTIRLGDKALAPHFKLTQREFGFKSPEFTVNIANSQFYQDPVQVNLRRAVFELRFSHPVQADDLEKHLSLAYAGQASGAVKYTVTLDKFKLVASVQSEPLPIPAESAVMALHLAAGVTAIAGGEGLKQDVDATVEIPGLNGLAISNVEATIVTGDDGEPQHVLQVESSMAVSEREIGAKVSAWALPARGKGEEAQGWDDPDEVTDDILKRAKRVPLSLIAHEQDADQAHSFRFNAEPGTALFVRVQKGLKSVGGYQLGADRDAIVQITAFAPELAFMSKGSLLALGGEKKIPVLVRDLPGIRVDIGRVLPQQLHLLATTGGNFSQPQFLGAITPDHLSERFSRAIPLKLRTGKTHYETIDFGDYLKPGHGDRHGAFLVSVRGYDPKNPTAGDDASAWTSGNNYGYADQPEGDGPAEGEGEDAPDTPKIDPTTKWDTRLVLVTDLGFIIKRALDGSQDVYVQSIGSGDPVADATVEVWGRNGLILASQKTDSGGHVHIANLSGFRREKEPVMVLVEKAGDMSFMTLNHADRNLDLSRFDVGGVQSTGLPSQMRAYVFSDRGIYRPGDTMHFGIVAKSADWNQALKDLPVEVEITDARGMVVRREAMKLGPAGMAEASFTTLDTAPTGTYTVHLNLARETGTAAGSDAAPLILGATTVKVQEFMPDRMKVAVHLSQEVENGWVSPKALAATVDVKNLFGTPAPKRRVESTLTLMPAFPSFRGYEDYAFFDPQRAKDKFSDDLAKAETDDKGHVDVDLGLQRYAAATYQLNLLVKAFEPEGGRSVAAEVSSLVSDMPFLVGFKADGDLGYINRDGVRKISLIAIDPHAQKTAAAGLHIERVERRVLSVLVKQPNGLYKYESKQKETLIKSEPLAMPATGATLMLATDAPGNYAYIVRNADGLALNRIEYSVVGTGNVTRSLDRNAELQLALNKKSYEPGEDIEVSIRAPYTGAGLITIERDHVFAYQWFKADKNATVQKIHLPKDFEGSGYVNVQYVRSLASNEVYMSPMSYGVVPFSTSLAARTADIKLSAPALVKPGQTVKMQLTAAKPVRAVVFAVDEGILQVARYKNPDPLQFFFQKHALEVGTAQTLDLILPEFRKLMQAAAPGGDAEGGLGKHLNPFKRKGDKPVVYWSGVVDVDGSKSFDYTVPESFNGALRIMAVAVSDATAAAKATSTTVRGDLILLPTVPVALTPGDEADIGVGLANNVHGSGKAAPVTVGLQTSPQLEVVGPPRVVLNVAERGEASTVFHVRAKADAGAELGNADLVFTAQYKDAHARLGTNLSIRPASTLVTLVKTGRVRAGEDIPLNGNMYPNFHKGELAVSATPWSYAAGLIQYLQSYPHGCTEQITSQMFPTVVLASRPELQKALSTDAAKLRAKGYEVPDPKLGFLRTVGMLRTRQNAEGAFGLWDAGYVEPFANVYATHMLLEARERKFNVPEDMYQRALAYLQNYVAQPADKGLYDWRSKAYATYVLTRAGVVTTSAVVNLKAAAPRGKDDRTDIGNVYLAASYAMLKQDKAAQDLLQPAWADWVARTAANKVYNRWGYYYDPLVHDSLMLYLVAKHFPAKLNDVPVEFFDRIGALIQAGNYYSLSSADVVLAIDAFDTNQSKAMTAGGLTVTAQGAQGRVLNLPVDMVAGNLAKSAVPVDATKLHLENKANVPLFYSFAETGYERGAPAAATGHGVEVLREYLNAQGKPVTEAAVGEELTVHLHIRSTNQAEIAQVVVADLLPGGLEPVLSMPGDDQGADDATPVWLKRIGGKGSWKIQYADIREDRVLFYGNVTTQDSDVTYKVRATNAGQFVVPGLYAEALYDRKTFARSAGGRFTVKPVPN